MNKLILGFALVLMSATSAFAEDATRQSCKIDAGVVYCMGGSTTYDIGCEANCTGNQTAVCTPASGWAESDGTGLPSRCDLQASLCTCE